VVELTLAEVIRFAIQNGIVTMEPHPVAELGRARVREQAPDKFE
jgi:hypothetical protein